MAKTGMQVAVQMESMSVTIYNIGGRRGTQCNCPRPYRRRGMSGSKVQVARGKWLVRLAAGLQLLQRSSVGGLDLRQLFLASARLVLRRFLTNGCL